MRSPGSTRRFRHLAVAAQLAVLAGVAAAPGAAEAERRPRRDRLVEAVGPARSPAYVRSNELADIDSATFKKARGHQSARPGDGRTIHLNPAREVYLWVIDQSGVFHVAPYQKRPDGSENIGHPMLVGGRRARMAGELHFVRRKKSGKDVWVLDSDSGRYIKPYPDVSKAQLVAARRLIARIEISSGRPGGKLRPVKLRTRFVEPGTDKPEMKKVFALSRQVGGYVLLPPKGSTRSGLPARLRGKSARAAWQRRTRARLAPRGR